MRLVVVNESNQRGNIVRSVVAGEQDASELRAKAVVYCYDELGVPVVLVGAGLQDA